MEYEIFERVHKLGSFYFYAFLYIGVVVAGISFWLTIPMALFAKHLSNAKKLALIVADIVLPFLSPFILAVCLTNKKAKIAVAGSYLLLAFLALGAEWIAEAHNAIFPCCSDFEKKYMLFMPTA